jgi:hypothetical protein
MSELAWAFAFVIMVTVLGSTAVGCVAIIERGKNKRTHDREVTQRQGMDNALHLEEQKLLTLPPGERPQLGTGLEFQLPAIYNED